MRWYWLQLSLNATCNSQTIARGLILTPALAGAIYSQAYVPALGILATAAATDWLDGYLARTIPGQASSLGSILDPAADKLLMTTLVASLASGGLMPLPVATLVISRFPFALFLIPLRYSIFLLFIPLRHSSLYFLYIPIFLYAISPLYFLYAILLLHHAYSKYIHQMPRDVALVMSSLRIRYKSLAKGANGKPVITKDFFNPSISSIQITPPLVSKVGSFLFNVFLVRPTLRSSLHTAGHVWHLLYLNTLDTGRLIWRPLESR